MKLESILCCRIIGERNMILEKAIVDVQVTDDTLTVNLADGRTVSVPVEWYPRLAHGTGEEQRNWRLIGRGAGINWPDLDEDISLDNLLLGSRPARVKNLCAIGWIPEKFDHSTTPLIIQNSPFTIDRYLFINIVTPFTFDRPKLKPINRPLRLRQAQAAGHTSSIVGRPSSSPHF